MAQDDCNAIESTTVIAEQQGPRLQEVSLLKCNSCRHKTKGKKLLTFRRLQVHKNSLNEVWEGVDPGSPPSSHSGALHTPEFPWVGPAFPSGAQSLLQALT